MFSFPKFIDTHVHFREVENFHLTVPETIKWCQAALYMPNTKQPLSTMIGATKYEVQLKSKYPNFNFIPTLYLQEQTSKGTIEMYNDTGGKHIKIYPRGKTTHSDHGIFDYKKIYPVLEEMERLGMFAHFHCEHPNAQASDAEKVFLIDILQPIVDKFKELKIVIEHISTKTAVDFVFFHMLRRKIVATITPQHLWGTIDTILNTGNMSAYCKPCLQHSVDREVLLYAATSTYDNFMLGSDSAPHSYEKKFNYHSCPGCWTAPWLAHWIFEIFEARNSLDKFIDFTVNRAAKWLGITPDLTPCLSINENAPTVIPMHYNGYIPFMPGHVFRFGVKHGAN